jgi:hypothetical protein
MGSISAQCAINLQGARSPPHGPETPQRGGDRPTEGRTKKITDSTKVPTGVPWFLCAVLVPPHNTQPRSSSKHLIQGRYLGLLTLVACSSCHLGAMSTPAPLSYADSLEA